VQAFEHWLPESTPYLSEDSLSAYKEGLEWHFDEDLIIILLCFHSSPPKVDDGDSNIEHHTSNAYKQPQPVTFWCVILVCVNNILPGFAFLNIQDFWRGHWCYPWGMSWSSCQQGFTDLWHPTSQFTFSSDFSTFTRTLLSNFAFHWTTRCTGYTFSCSLIVVVAIFTFTSYVPIWGTFWKHPLMLSYTHSTRLTSFKSKTGRKIHSWNTFNAMNLSTRSYFCSTFHRGTMSFTTYSAWPASIALPRTIDNTDCFFGTLFTLQRNCTLDDWYVINLRETESK